MKLYALIPPAPAKQDVEAVRELAAPMNREKYGFRLLPLTEGGFGIPSGPSPPSAFGIRNLRFRIAIAAAQAQVLQGMPARYPRGWLAAHARIWIDPPYGV